jgi:hypothetical protein
VADVVLEETLSTVVGEALAQLHDSNEICRSGQVLAYTAQMLLLILIWLLAVGSLLGARIIGRPLLRSLLLCRHIDAAAGDEAANGISLLTLRLALVEFLVQPGGVEIEVSVKFERAGGVTSGLKK